MPYFFIVIAFILLAMVVLGICDNADKKIVRAAILFALTILGFCIPWIGYSIYDNYHAQPIETVILDVVNVGPIQCINYEGGIINLNKREGRTFGKKIKLIKYPQTNFGIEWVGDNNNHIYIEDVEK